ncbi:hypothetical protein HAX54_051092, partial [Datura stramonium]|nr:hypothetical protein [Datura stramonium]
APDSGEVLSSVDVPSPSDDVVTSNAVGDGVDDGDIESSSDDKVVDDEAVESQSTNAPQPNVFSITDPQ